MAEIIKKYVYLYTYDRLEKIQNQEDREEFSRYTAGVCMNSLDDHINILIEKCKNLSIF